MRPYHHSPHVHGILKRKVRVQRLLGIPGQGVRDVVRLESRGSLGLGECRACRRHHRPSLGLQVIHDLKQTRLAKPLGARDLQSGV